jgi:hypothetical protein
MFQSNERVNFKNGYTSEKVFSEITKDEFFNRSVRSMHIPSHIDLVIYDEDTKKTTKFRDYYPTQIFVTVNPHTPGKFFHFLRQMRNGYYQLKNIVTDANNYPAMYNPSTYTSSYHELQKYLVSSVFLRYMYAPFSVIEFKQNEVVNWADLMSCVNGGYKFYTNNGKVYSSSYVIYIPIGAAIQIIDVHGCEVHELTHTIDSIENSIANSYRKITHIECTSDENLKNMCIMKENPIKAKENSMTIRIQMKISPKNPYTTPVFKVL